MLAPGERVVFVVSAKLDRKFVPSKPAVPTPAW